VAGTFRSSTYGYSVKLPAQWSATDAQDRWNGTAALAIDSPNVDKFMGPSTGASWGAAAQWPQSLSANVNYAIAWTAVNHGDTCPPQPQAKRQVTIGGQPGVLLEYNCGILINMATTVHSGVAYWFVFRDPGVDAASNPADHATFTKLLESVQFPQ
jgi:hypothetical protein